MAIIEAVGDLRDTSTFSPLVEPRSSDLKRLELFNDAAVLANLLEAEIANENWLDAFLLAVGVQQLVEDRCVGMESLAYRGNAHFLKRRGRSVGQIERLGRTLVGGGARALALVHRSHRAVRLSSELEVLLGELAALAAGGNAGRVTTSRSRDVIPEIRALAEALHGDVIRIPSCFYSFDQHPRDLQAMVADFAERWPTRDIPLCVMGVRTSGAYLAPLCAEYLRQQGYEEVQSLTIRPGFPIPHRQGSRLSQVARSGGKILVIDDPPESGSSLVAAITQIVRCKGISRQQIVLLLAHYGDELQLPAALAEVSSVKLRYAQWDINRRLQAPNITSALGGLLGPACVVRWARVMEHPTSPVRGHASTRIRIEWEDEEQIPHREDIIAEGIGLGYFGRHVSALADAAPSLFPLVLGVVDGVCYRRSLPPSERIAVRDWRTAEAIANHILERHRALRLDTDTTPKMSGRQPAWEIATRILGRGVGRGGIVVRPLFIESLVRETLTAPAPSVVDAMPSLRNWYLSPGEQVARKVHFGEGPYGHHDLASYDPIFDLAGAAVATDDWKFERELRGSYELASKETIEPERWLLHRLVHLWDLQRLGSIDQVSVRRRSARAVAEYFSERYLRDVAFRRATGPYCTLDIDGVLETSPMGFPATTEEGALALRALLAHGYRVLLATGRSLDEVVERCKIYYLDGGVAEYGSVVYDHLTGTINERVPDRSALAIRLVRRAALDEDGLVVDRDFQRLVRCYKEVGHGRRTGLDPEVVERILRAADVEDQVLAIDGEEQTDFVARSVNKGAGVRAFLATAQSLLSRNPGEIALAVGDGEADLTMLRLASLGLAPGNAHQSLRANGIRKVRPSYQAGLKAAVEQLIQHCPGECPTCAAPKLSPSAKAIVGLLSLHGGGMAGIPSRVLRLEGHRIAERLRQ